MNKLSKDFLTMHNAASRTAIINIGRLLTPQGSKARGAKAQGDILNLQGPVYILAEGGVITRIKQGQPDDKELVGCQVLDAKGQLLTPGLVDAHTHLVFGGWRAHELQLKLAGVPYLDILKAGGGILSTVEATRKASQQELMAQAGLALDDMMSKGTTTCEAKSGYGLNLEDELKQLRAARELNSSHPLEIVSTLMAAHALPKEYQGNKRGFIDLIIQEIIPRVAGEGLAEFCDVFCEEGIFSSTEAREILLAGQRYGLASKIHTDEIFPIGGTELAGEIAACSAEHLIAMTDQGLRALKDGGVIACLLPGTSFYLDKPYARARDMIEMGVPVAVASDFNPGSCPGNSLQFCMNLASYQYKMRPEEILTAVTLNAAAAIKRADSLGSLEVGKRCDAVIWQAEDLDFVLYRFGSNLVDRVIKNGKPVYQA